MQTIHAAGHTWQVIPLDVDEQFEVECILVNTLGPSAGNAIASLVEGLAPAIVDILRDATGRGEEFDLGKLLGLKEMTPGMREQWLIALDMTRKACRPEDGGAPIPVSEAVPCDLPAWRGVLDCLDALQADADGDAGEINYEDPILVTAWSELIAALVESFERAVERSEVFDLAAVLPLQGRAGPAWLALIGASLAKVVRETAGRGVSLTLPGFLRVLGKIDTADPRFRKAWDEFVGSLASTAGDIVRGAVFSLAGRLNVTDVKRLFHLAVLNKKVMHVGGSSPAYVTDYGLVTRLIGASPRAKWELLSKVLGVTYSRAPDASAGGGDA